MPVILNKYVISKIYYDRHILKINGIHRRNYVTPNIIKSLEAVNKDIIPIKLHPTTTCLHFRYTPLTYFMRVFIERKLFFPFDSPDYI